MDKGSPKFSSKNVQTLFNEMKIIIGFWINSLNFLSLSAISLNVASVIDLTAKRNQPEA